MQRRNSERVNIKVFVDQIVNADQSALCVSSDLSAGGMSVQGVSGPAWGKPNHVWLHFELPGENQPCIRALGELKYERKLSNGQRIRGYRFKYMAPRERVAYNRFLAELDVRAAA